MTGRTIFVFGSNRQGRHGKGAALYARTNFGAKTGKPKGRQGNAYAIVTKELRHYVEPVTLDEVKQGIEEFIKYAIEHDNDEFIITRIGCGLAGFKDEQIAPLFKKAPSNCILPDGWRTKEETK